MRHIFIPLLLILFISNVFAQLQPAAFHQKPQKKFIQHPTGSSANSNSRLKQCDTDTVYYAYNKATGLQGLNINTANSADKVSQWFEAPQQMLLHGFTFYAWQSFGSNDTITLTCKAVLAGADSFPTGPVLATATARVDSAFANGSLAALERKVIFANPVLVNYPYALVVETSSPINVAIVCSDWDSLDGGMEWLSSANIPGSGWLHGYNVYAGGVQFDADFMFQPIVSYQLDASYAADTNCIFNGGAVTFTNTTDNPVQYSRFYNQYVVNGTQNLNFTWDYDDGSPLDLVFDTSHTFAAGSDYDVRLNAVVVGWNAVCQETFTTRINPATVSDFTYSANGLNVTFTNLSTNVDSVYWNFGDGQTSASLNPVHTFSSEANYNVTLICYGPCGGDTLKTLVSLCDPLASGFNYTVAGSTVSFSVTAITGSASFFWTFGDGGSGSGITTNHAYTANGAYSVCLIASNSCESDTTCQQVIVNATGINDFLSESVSIFPNPANDLLTVKFSDAQMFPVEISLYDHVGKLLLRSVPSSFNKSYQLDVSGFPQGVYLLKIETAEGMAVRKVVKGF